jgi:hypothetical protein
VNDVAKLDPKVNILFVATDGDPGYNARYKSQFNAWFPLFRQDGLTSCLNHIAIEAEQNQPLYVADFLHVVKNVRSRFISYATGMHLRRGPVVFWWYRMANVIKLGPAFSDRSSTGKMRDVYPILLFRLEHVITLFKHKCPAEALYLLPWALIFRALQSSVLSRQTRISVLLLALRFLIFFYEKDAYSGIPENTRRGTFPTDREPQIEDCVRPFREITLIRCMNTVIGLIFALARITENIPLDRIGTHPLENLFGLLRRILHDCNRFDELLHAVARTIVVDQIFEDLKYHRDICGRKNVGGVVSKYNAESTECIIDPEPTYKDIQKLVRTVLHDPSADIDDNPAMKWLCAFNEDSMTDEIRREIAVLLRITSNGQILPKLIQRMGW